MAGRAASERRPRPFTLEVGGIPILSFAATSIREAQSIRREAWLQNDLRSARLKGAAIWDGKAKLSVRAAFPDETLRFSQAIERAADDSGELVLIYLVTLDK
jgi:hypothetical protein